MLALLGCLDGIEMHTDQRNGEALSLGCIGLWQHCLAVCDDCWSFDVVKSSGTIGQKARHKDTTDSRYQSCYGLVWFRTRRIMEIEAHYDDAWLCQA